MTGLLRHPLLTFALLVAWLLLTVSLSPGNILLGGLIALALSGLFTLLALPETRLRLNSVLRLLWAVFVEVVRSNNAVAWIILRPGHAQNRRSGFVHIPLEMRAPYGLAALACIITSTPGTIWVDHDSRRNVLLIHVLDLVDEASWIDSIKQRYERPLLEIFQ